MNSFVSATVFFCKHWLTLRKVWRSPVIGGLLQALYAALSARDVDTVQKLLAPDLEWWFHGPPSHQFMMRLLTGTATSESDLFEFNPVTITALGSTVLAEGRDHGRQISWVHAWTVTDGINHPSEEYFKHVPYRHPPRRRQRKILTVRFLLEFDHAPHTAPPSGRAG
ncbi:unnamed protein product [Thlaspi arvense]|uniref:Wound-induced protein 1 n=1 Tax=Thlaspi arvense TaxID=13288 RepID=A0AAU9S2F0_THLAR|nr:unnamed protein product [Thlaspi arvense]